MSHPTAKIILGRGIGLYSHLNDWKSQGSNLGLQNKESNFTIMPGRLLSKERVGLLIVYTYMPV